MICVPTPEWIRENVTLPDTTDPLDVFSYIFDIGPGQATYASQ